MAKMKKKLSWLYIALGTVVGLGAIMGASRLFSKDEGVDRSELGINIQKEDVNVAGYELMLAYDDADKILDICRSAMEDSNRPWLEQDYTYMYIAEYADVDYMNTKGSILIVYDYAKNAKDDALSVLFMGDDGVNAETILTVDKSGISGQATGFTLPTSTDLGEGFYFHCATSYKFVYGAQDIRDEEGYIADHEANVYMPKEIVKLVRLVAPAD